MEKPVWGFFALVTYVPAPLGYILDNLRQRLPGNHFAQAHITLLPPRPLRVPVEAAAQCARQILTRFSAFDVELTDVRAFPETDVLYLKLADGDYPVHELHDALNTGELSHEEQFEFRPHLTLGGPIPPMVLNLFHREVESFWKSVPCSKRFTVDNIVALWSGSTENKPEWRRLWNFEFQNYQSQSARAGD